MNESTIEKRQEDWWWGHVYFEWSSPIQAHLIPFNWSCNCVAHWATTVQGEITPGLAINKNIGHAVEGGVQWMLSGCGRGVAFFPNSHPATPPSPYLSKYSFTGGNKIHLTLNLWLLSSIRCDDYLIGYGQGFARVESPNSQSLVILILIIPHLRNQPGQSQYTSGFSGDWTRKVQIKSLSWF